MQDQTGFHVGQIVVVKATPSVRGAVVEVVPGEGCSPNPRQVSPIGQRGAACSVPPEASRLSVR